MKLKYIIGLTFVLGINQAHALIEDVCAVAERTQNFNSALMVGESFTQEQIEKYQAKLVAECNLSKKYLSANSKAKEKLGVDLTRLTEYQAMRFTQRSWYEVAKSNNKPLEKIYQIFRVDYSKPVSEQNTLVWDDWSKGILSLQETVNQVGAGITFDSHFLKKIHRGLFPFYPYVDEHGDFAHDPNPGVFKPTESRDNDNYWWALRTQEEVNEARMNSDQINTEYANLGLLSAPPVNFTANNGELTPVPSYVGNIVSVRLRDDRDNKGQQVLAFHSGHPMMNRQNTDLILNFVHTMLAKAHQQKPMSFKNRLFTPGELAFFVQQYYVRVHPFYEGNGRTSRFIQELILQSFNLPHGASGDLMDIDALSQTENYYQIAMQKTFDIVNKANQCIDEVKNIGHSNASYDCRVLENREQEWVKLDQINKGELISEDYPDAIVKKNQRENQLAYLDKVTELQHKAEMQARGVLVAEADKALAKPVVKKKVVLVKKTK